MDAYATEAEGVTYFGERLETDAWDDATSVDRVKALKMATRAIERLSFAGDMTDSEQEKQFPRGGDSVVPDDIKNACIEEALSLLDGKSPELEFENLGITQQSYSNVKSSYDRSQLPENIIAGITSIIAWRFLKPYLRDALTVNLNRVS